jgi:hypothetical protein
MSGEEGKASMPGRTASMVKGTVGGGVVVVGMAAGWEEDMMGWLKLANKATQACSSRRRVVLGTSGFSEKVGILRGEILEQLALIYFSVPLNRCQSHASK